MKEELIRRYILSIDFNKDDWKMSSIREEMRSFLGEIPSIDIQYEKDSMLNEESGESEVIEKVKKVSIVFTETDDKFKKIEFLVDSPR